MKPGLGNPQIDLQDKGVIDSGCSRHMTGNMSYLIDYEEIDEGYVAFRGNSKGGKSLEKVPLKLLIDESQILLRVPRKNNMYSVDLKNIVPKEGLTYLFAKATSDESKLWHRRLGHLNFKTMNKLVKGNLVRGLPSKLFENDQTCVACQKGKQHKASYDYSRFTWVFFLATKDETSCILKSFITGIENLVDHKVKVIRCDNGTEFKNREMNQFCEMKEAVITACYVQNIVLVVKPHYKTPYELSHGRIPTLSFMRPFGYPVTILNTIDHLGKFNSKADEGTQSNGFAGIKASDNAGQARKETEPKVDEGSRKESECNNQEKEDNVNSTNNVNAAGTNKVNAVDDGAVADMNNLDTTIQVSPIPTTRIHKDHPLDQVIGDLQSATQTRKMSNNLEEHGKNPKRNSDPTDVKSAFLYGKIEEEVYVCQPPGFEDLDFLDRVYKVEKALYGLHQAPRAWYETLSTYLSDNEFQRGKIDKNLFIKRFTKVKTASTPMETQKPLLKDEDGEEVDVHMYRSMIGSLMYFTSSRPDIMFAVCACARY
ncbi:putative ribonuclease H-like domain-containing protein [Tanacetum coccineum]